MRYYVQHGAGLGDLVADAMKVDLREVDFLFRDDSSIVFDTPSARKQMATLPYVKNVFEVLDTVARGSLPGSVDQLVKTIRKRGLPRDRRQGAPFRTMMYIDGQLMGLPAQTRARLEAVIAEQTGGRLNARGGSGVEFWVIGRRDLDLLMFCLKVTTRAEKARPRGSLSSDLSTLLIKASAPHHNDVFLDPFGGSGSIVDARLEFPFRKVIYSDLRLADHRPNLPRRIGTSRHVDVLAEDALRLPSVPDDTVTAIVTDPPWGEHEQLDTPYEDFAAAMLSCFDRVLDRRRGRLVLLLSRQATSTVADLWKQSLLQLWDSYDILVNGHPATVLLGGR